MAINQSATAIIVVALSVAGCSTVNSHYPKPDNRIVRSPLGTAHDRFGVERDVVIVKSTKDGAKRREQLIDETKGTAGSIGTLLVDYQTASTAARSPSADASRANFEYRRAGFNLSRGVCTYAFNQLGETHSKYNFGNKTFGIISNGGASILGITKASGRSTSLYALGIGLLQAWLDNYEEYAFLAQSVSTLQAKVREAQDKYEGGINEMMPKTWGEATIQIQTYNDFCLETGMRKLVDDAVGKAQLQFNKENKEIEVINNQSDTIRRIVEFEKERAIYQEQLAVNAKNYTETLNELNAGLKIRAEAASNMAKIDSADAKKTIDELKSEIRSISDILANSNSSEADKLASSSRLSVLQFALAAKSNSIDKGSDWEQALISKKDGLDRDKADLEKKLADLKTRSS